MRTFKSYYYEENLLVELNRQKKELARKYDTDPNQQFKGLISHSPLSPKDAVSQAIETLKSSGKPKPGYQYTTEKKLLVRCIPTFIGIYAKDNGDIVFHRDVRRTGESLAVDRKTIHFTINGAVGDHFGNTWENAMIAIIADPTTIKARPRTVRFEDTWYMVDKNNELNIGKATVLIPSQMQIPDDMRSANIKRYPGNSSDDRDQAINNFLKQNGVNILEINAHGARPKGSGSFSRNDWDEKNEIKKARKDLNPIKWEKSGSPHNISVEGSVEGIVMSIRSIYRFLRENNLTFNNLYDYEMWSKLEGNTEGHSFEHFIGRVKRRLPKMRHELINYRKEDENSYFYFARAYKYMKEFLQKVDSSNP